MIRPPLRGNSGSVRVIIVEDHPAFAEGLAALLRREPGIVVAGTARTADEAVHLLDRVPCDVVVCDVMIGGRDAGFDLLARFRLRARFLMLSAFEYQAHHARALAGGAGAYLSKLTDVEPLVRTIRRIARGERAFSGEVLESARNAPPAPTRRELQLLALLDEGTPNEDIATGLGIRVKTVEGMLRRLFIRYGVTNRTQLARLAVEQGWLTSRSKGDGPADEAVT